MEYLRRFTLWFASGLGAALGVALVVYAFGKYTEREWREKREAWLPSSSIDVKDVEFLPVAKEVSVAATIANNATQDVAVELDLIVSQGAKVLYTCTRSAPRTPGPGKTVRIQVSCSDIEKQSLPSDASYSLKVHRVRPTPT